MHTNGRTFAHLPTPPWPTGYAQVPPFPDSAVCSDPAGGDGGFHFKKTMGWWKTNGKPETSLSRPSSPTSGRGKPSGGSHQCGGGVWGKHALEQLHVGLRGKPCNGWWLVAAKKSPARHPWHWQMLEFPWEIWSSPALLACRLALIGLVDEPLWVFFWFLSRQIWKPCLFQGLPKISLESAAHIFSESFLTWGPHFATFVEIQCFCIIKFGTLCKPIRPELLFNNVFSLSGRVMAKLKYSNEKCKI